MIKTVDEARENFKEAIKKSISSSCAESLKNLGFNGLKRMFNSGIKTLNLSDEEFRLIFSEAVKEMGEKK